MKKYSQPKPVKMPATYDGMGTKKDPHPYMHGKPEPTNPKIGTVRGHGKGAKKGYMSKNG